MQQLRREELTLLAVALAEGKSLSRLQLQKAVFLIQEQLPEVAVPPHPQLRYEFQKYNYGAFCKDIYVDAFKLAKAGLATAEPDSAYNFETLAATPPIASHRNNILRRLPFEIYARTKRIVDWVLQLDFETLVSEVYSQYPEYKENSMFRRVKSAIGARFATPPFSEIVPGLIMRGYVIRDRLSVQRFLRQHTFLVPLLEEAITRIPDYFPGALVTLDVFQDPESEDALEHLFLNIETSLSAKEARSNLRSLQRDWWLSELPKAQGQMTIGLEYI